MSTSQKRIKAMQAIVAGSIISRDHTTTAAIIREFDEVHRVDKIQPLQRKRLLQILHSTRALDSFLKNFNTIHGIHGKDKSLGKYLRYLENHTNRHLAKLRPGRAIYYQNKIVKRRNLYIHEAGAYPANDNEILSLLSEMHSCLSEVIRL